MSAWTTRRTGQAVFAGCLTALGLFILHEVMGMPAAPAFAAVGPRAFPGVIGTGLVAIGLLQLRAALAGVRDATSGEAAPRHDWRAVAWVCATLATQILLLKWIGWIPAATLVFVGVARAFGSRRLGLDAAIGATLAVVTFTLFNLVLGLNLPAGKLLSAILGG